ncbi:MAG: RsmF rRNA methyltransferase first C-terminal domain-containing protein, partial [Lachnospiraceae bacterium]
YSTCTFAPEEDEETLAAFLSAHQDFLMVDLPSILGEDFARYGFSTGRPDWCRLSVPETIRENLSRAVRLFPQNLRGEGHFVARLTRGEETPSRHLSLVRAKKENTKRRGKETGQESLVLAFTTFAKENLKEVPPQTGVFVPFGTELYRMPADLPLQGLRVLRPGLDLGSLAHDRFVPGHALALALKPEQAKRYLNLASDSREAAAYLHGEAIPCDPTLRGYVLVGFDGYSAGWGKAAGGICKNHYPKGLRRPY